MTQKSLRISLLAVFAALASAGAAAAQTVAASFSGTGDPTANTGTGSGTLTPGGAAAVSFTVQDGKSDCSVLLNLTFNIVAANGDKLNLLFQTSSPDITAATPSATITGPLTVLAGGTGAYAGLGGSGTASLAVNFTSSTSFSYVFTATVTLGGALRAVSGITPGGIVPAGGAISVIQPGSWVSIYGANFIAASATWNGDFPLTLGGVSVTVDSKPAYLWFVGPGQINMQVPDDTKTGCVPVTVITPNGTFTESADLESTAPALSLLDNQYVVGEIPTPNGSGAYGVGANSYDLVGPVGHFSFNTRPVKRGESVVLYGVGFGPTTPPVLAGKAFSGVARTTATVQAAIGFNKTQNFFTVPVAFAGLVGAGLYQINITIPNNLPAVFTGDLNIVLNVGPFGSGVPVSQNLNLLLTLQ